MRRSWWANTGLTSTRVQVGGSSASSTVSMLMPAHRGGRPARSDRRRGRAAGRGRAPTAPSRQDVLAAGRRPANRVSPKPWRSGTITTGLRVVRHTPAPAPATSSACTPAWIQHDRLGGARSRSGSVSPAEARGSPRTARSRDRRAGLAEQGGRLVAVERPRATRSRSGSRRGPGIERPGLAQRRAATGTTCLAGGTAAGRTVGAAAVEIRRWPGRRRTPASTGSGAPDRARLPRSSRRAQRRWQVGRQAGERGIARRRQVGRRPAPRARCGRGRTDRGGADRLAARLLGRHVARRAGRRAVIVGGAGDSEVARYAVSLRSSRDVRRLDVAVDHAALVGVGERAGDLARDRTASDGSIGPACGAEQGLALDERHDHEAVAVFEQRHDVRMRQARDHPRLARQESATAAGCARAATVA